MTTVDPVEVTDYAEQAREFLRRAHTYLANGDLHQASEKGWGAAAHMVKAVAAANGWENERHRDFYRVIIRAWEITGDDRLRHFGGVADHLHENFYSRTRHMNARAIAAEIEDMSEFVSLLDDLIKPDVGQV